MIRSAIRRTASSISNQLNWWCNVIDERLGPGQHVGHRVVAPIAFGFDAIQRRPATLFVVVRQILGHVEEPLEVVLVVAIVFDDQLALGVGHAAAASALAFDSAVVVSGSFVVDFDLIEHRVVFHLLLDAFLQRHERQLQNFHRLDHPRCKHLLLSQLHLLAER